MIRYSGLSTYQRGCCTTSYGIPFAALKPHQASRTFVCCLSRAQHTRFQHSLGAFYLMSEAITQLASKGNFIFDSEAEAVQAAILLHDIGHGPFSHVLEDTIVKGVSHEEISLMLMERMNREMNGQLSLAIQIFKDEYPKRFLHQLVSGQLDMDRLDYLRRDSFYTGVSEGNIGSARIIKMLDVADDHLVVESKGIYSIENFLTARRLMYWQVYLHKTSVAYERMLISALLRAKELASKGVELFASPALKFFCIITSIRKCFTITRTVWRTLFNWTIMTSGQL